MTALLELDTWIPILDGDPVAAEIYAGHYASVRSRARRLERGTLLILGPGQKLLLSTPCRRAMFAWRKFIDDTGQTGINCAVFANHGAGLSSRLIAEADAIADCRWPGERHYTYVDSTKVSANPGYCFKQAGWSFIGRTKSRRLHILAREAA